MQSDPTVLIFAFDLNPRLGSEAGKAYDWVRIAARSFSTITVVSDRHEADLRNNPIGTEFVFIRQSHTLTRLLRSAGAHNLIYRDFTRRAARLLPQLLRSRPISLVHYLTPSGIHSFSDQPRRFDAPYVVGPLGGGLVVARSFLATFPPAQRARELLRNLFYRRLSRHEPFREYLSGARMAIIGTDYLLKFFREKQRPDTVTLFDTFVDPSTISPAPRARSSTVRLLYAGRIAETKGLPFLIRALHRIRSENSVAPDGIHLSVVGDGPARKRCEKLTAHCSVEDQVTFLGPMSQAELYALYPKFDIFCLPTLREPGGATILEAMAAGLPVVTSDFGGPRFSVTDTCGIRVALETPEQFEIGLSQAIMRLVNDPELGRRMGRAGRRRVEEQFSVRAFERMIPAIYRRALEHRENAR